MADAADAVSAAAAALSGPKPDRAAELRRREALLREQRLEDASGALDAWLAAQALAPQDLATASEAIRVGALAGRWDGAARALVTVSVARLSLSSELLASLEESAAGAEAFGPLAAGLAAATPAPGEVDGQLGRALEAKVGELLDRAGDAEGAEAALVRALAHERGHTATLQALARIQWRQPGRPLVETLLALADNFADDLDPLHDAARLALETVSDSALATGILERLLRSARRLWEGGTPATGERAPKDAALFAHGELVRLALEAGQHARAVDLLVDGARMPVEAGESRAMRRQAGELSREKLGDQDRALRLLQSVVDESVEDAQAVAQLGALLEQRGRFPELLALRQRQLELDLDAETRLGVRLEVARILGLIEAQGGRVGVLRANLEERPGHEESIERLAEILSGRGRSQELAELLTTQAAEVEQQGDAARGANLWSRAAVLLETELSDVDASLKAHRRVVALQPDVRSLDALARLHMDRGEPGVAAEWLKRRLDAAGDDERRAIALRLADAHLAAGHVEATTGVLERMLKRDPTASEARARLAGLYREAGAHEPLARLLAEGAPHEPDEETRLAYVREAAQLYEVELGQPDQAIPVLQMGVELAPDDQSLKSKLALGLRVAGRLEEARAILEDLASSFGRRRSPERAAVHFALAQVAHAGGDLEGAMEELEQARKMDMSHPGILRMAGQMAREAGQLERAEKSYRALLLVVRRQDPGAPDVTVGASEVLYELSLLATEQKDEAQAAELLESALSTAAQHDAEATRFTKDLLARGAVDLAARAVDMRLAAVESPRARPPCSRARRSSSAITSAAPRRRSRRCSRPSRWPRSRPPCTSGRAPSRKKMGAVPRYAEVLSTLADKQRRKEEAPFKAELLLRLGEVTGGRPRRSRRGRQALREGREDRPARGGRLEGAGPGGGRARRQQRGGARPPQARGVRRRADPERGAHAGALSDRGGGARRRRGRAGPRHAAERARARAALRARGRDPASGRAGAPRERRAARAVRGGRARRRRRGDDPRLHRAARDAAVRDDRARARGRGARGRARGPRAGRGAALARRRHRALERARLARRAVDPDRPLGAAARRGRRAGRHRMDADRGGGDRRRRGLRPVDARGRSCLHGGRRPAPGGRHLPQPALDRSGEPRPLGAAGARLREARGSRRARGGRPHHARRAARSARSQRAAHEPRALPAGRGEEPDGRDRRAQAGARRGSRSRGGRPQARGHLRGHGRHGRARRAPAPPARSRARPSGRGDHREPQPAHGQAGRGRGSARGHGPLPRRPGLGAGGRGAARGAARAPGRGAGAAGPRRADGAPARREAGAGRGADRERADRALRQPAGRVRRGARARPRLQGLPERRVAARAPRELPPRARGSRGAREHDPLRRRAPRGHRGGHRALRRGGGHLAGDAGQPGEGRRDHARRGSARRRISACSGGSWPT
ncbi:MAG: hypothetical protein M5U28_40520 [Sandaracinaceae bacterium]|nr:hypothetical protein [Sandaracinaceae bacterium]